MHITIETAGTVYAPVACDLMSISPKLANSTPEGEFRAQHERLRLQPDVLRRLMSDYDYQLKFVIAREADIAEVMRGRRTSGGAPGKGNPDARRHYDERRWMNAARGLRKSARIVDFASARACTFIFTGTSAGYSGC